MDDEKIHIDLTGVYAYTDPAYARDRELWRGFLSYVLPVVISEQPEVIENEINTALVFSAEELTVGSEHAEVNMGSGMRCISTLLAKEIGVSPEFALASFYEGVLPTKLYKIKGHYTKKTNKEVKEDNVVGNWLSKFSKIQSDKKFISKTEKWKSMIKSKND